MFCQNCGKELPADSVYCDACGIRIAPVNGGAGHYNAAAAEPVRHRKFSKKAVIGIGLGAGAVVVLCAIILAVTAVIGHFWQPHRTGEPYAHHEYYGGNNYDYGIPGGNGYGNYRGYSSGSGAGGGDVQNNEGSAAPEPTDKNGRSMSDPNYEWPTGDGTYEFYAKSTIPKFESVTGKICKETQSDSTGSYYIYDMDMDAYNKYIEVIKNAGYTQSEFDVQGKNSYVVYSNGNQYLEIYLMNSDNEIVIMA